MGKADRERNRVKGAGYKTMQSFEMHPITITYNYFSINHLYCI